MRYARSPLLLAGVCLGWGTIPLVAAETGLPAAAIVFARVWVAAAGLGLIVATVRPPGPRLLSIAPRRALLAGAVLAGHWTAMFAAYARADDALVIFLIFLAPVAIAVIERPHARLVASLAIAATGFLLIAVPAVGRDESSLAGLAFAAISGVLFVALVLLSKPLAASYGGARVTFMQMAIAGTVLLPVAVATDWRGLGRAWPWLLLLGLAHTAIGTVVYFRTLAEVPATEVGVLGYLEPVGVVLFAWLLGGTAPAVSTVVGGALVVVGGTIAVATQSKPSEVAVRVPG